MCFECTVVFHISKVPMFPFFFFFFFVIILILASDQKNFARELCQSLTRYAEKNRSIQKHCNSIRRNQHHRTIPLIVQIYKRRSAGTYVALSPTLSTFVTHRKKLRWEKGSSSREH